MGGDGGVIANKRQFIRGISKEVDKNKETNNIVQSQRSRAKTCSLSGQVRK
jgi:hypothetical protein